MYDKYDMSRWLEHTPRRKTTRKVHARGIVKKALFSESVAKAYCISVRLPNFTNVMHRPREWVRLSCSTTFVKFGLSFRLHFGGGSPIQISLAALSDNIALCVNRKIRRFLIGGDKYSVCAASGGALPISNFENVASRTYVVSHRGGGKNSACARKL